MEAFRERRAAASGRGRKLLLADHRLATFLGHSFEYARSIGGHARGLGYDVTTLAARRVAAAVVEEVEAVPCFRTHAYERVRLPAVCALLPDDIAHWLAHEWAYLRRARAMLADLTAVQDRIRPDADTLALFPNVGYNEIAPVVRWANRFPEGRCPWVVLVLHFTAHPDYTRPDLFRQRYYERAFQEMERSRHRGRFRLFADSPALVEEYGSYTRLPVRLAPIPHAEPDRTGSRRHAHAPGPLRLAYLGDARAEKGFQLLPALFRRLTPEIRRDVVRGEVQANIRYAWESQVELAVRKLRAQPGVTLHENELTTAEYYDLFDRADVVLLPYTQAPYHAQTSGVFAEALARGKPVVAPRGTWMAAELKAHGAGVTFLPEDPQSFYEACRTAIARHPALRHEAEQRSARWRRRHSPAAYLETILDSLSAPARTSPPCQPGASLPTGKLAGSRKCFSR